MRSLRVLHVVTSLDAGGMENGVCNIATGLVPSIESYVACLERDGLFASKFPDRRAVHVLGKRDGFSIRAVIALAKLIRKTRPNVVHTHNLGPLIYASLATIGGGCCPIIHGEHAQLAPWELSPKRIRQRARLYRHCAAIHTVSHSQLEELHQLGFRHTSLTAIANGVDTTRFSIGSTTEAKARLGFPADVMLVGLVGRFGPFKRHDILIDAFNRLSPRIPSLHLIFIGGGGSEEIRIRDLARSHPKIHFTGFQAEPAPFYQALDLLVIPSTNEGMSNAALEAMACGVRVLGNVNCGHEQIISNGVNGYIADLRSAESIAGNVSEILCAPGSPVDMRNAARMTIADRFSLISMLEKYEHLYRAHARA